jgi:hypothetical protein
VTFFQQRHGPAAATAERPIGQVPAHRTSTMAASQQIGSEFDVFALIDVFFARPSSPILAGGQRWTT